jgi:hypothetical protein
MKTLRLKVVLLALVLQGLFTAQSATINVRLSPAQPVPRPVMGGALMPMLSIDIKVTDSASAPWVYLAVQQKGTINREKEGGNLRHVYLGTSEKLMSSQSPDFPYSLSLLGPVSLSNDEWKTVIVSAEFMPDLSNVDGMTVGLDIAGVVVDTYNSSAADNFTVVGSNPARGEYFPVDGVHKAESLSIKNVTSVETSIVASDHERRVFAQFDFIAENGDVQLSELPFSFYLGEGTTEALKNVRIRDDHGNAITDSHDVMSWDNSSWGYLTFRDSPVRVPQGTNHWIVEGTIDTMLVPDDTRLGVTFGSIAEVRGLATANWLPVNVDESWNTIELLNPEPFTGSFTEFLSVGSVGGDVRELQRILNMSPDTQIASDGPGSPGQEGYVFDDNMRYAVGRFQQKYGLHVTGFVDAPTRAFLNSHTFPIAPAQPVVNISQVEFSPLPNVNLLSVAMFGTIKPNTQYRVDVTKDFITWRPFGAVNQTESNVLQEVVGTIDSVEYADKAFFRLVEQP